MNATHATCACAVAFAALCAISSMTPAGDLDPPSGAISETMKSLDQVEPRIPVGDSTTPGDGLSTYVISTPGSYYLVGDLIQAPNKDGIRIDAPGVSLDLRGFAVRGVSGDGQGITATGSARDLYIHDGTIETFDQNGVALSIAFGCVYENLRSRGNGDNGFMLGGSSTVQSCTSFENGANGFVTNGIVNFENCAAESNAGDGFNASGSLRGCQSVANAADGFEIRVGVASECFAHGNSGTGFLVGDTGVVTLDNCTGQFNSIGFHAVGESSFSNCCARQSLFDGFMLDDGCTLLSCTATINGDDGFQLATGSTAHLCRAELNGYGFYVPAAESMVRIDSCAAISNTNIGFLMSGNLCLVVRNCAGGNSTDFNFAGTSQYGPVETASGTITSNNPWANFGDTLAAKIEEKQSPTTPESNRSPITSDPEARAARRSVR